jgi:hypothetical protein
MKPPYIIYSLPRSRSFWLSKFLTYGDWQCGHDELMHCRSLDDVTAWLSQECTGTVETSAAPHWRLAQHVTTVTIRRSVGEVIDSLRKMNVEWNGNLPEIIEGLDRKLDQIEKRIPCISIPYWELKSEDVCKQLFEYLLPYKHDINWWATLDAMNLQINFKHMLRRYHAYESQLIKLAKAAKFQTIANMTFEEVDRNDGITIREESFRKSYPEAKRLIHEHLVATGESPAGMADDDAFNSSLIGTLEDLGCLHTTVARSNGKIFGYLLTIVGPSLESPDVKVATHTAFAASAMFPGLGMKMQRAAIAALKEKGVDEIHYRAGIRGVGARAGVIYKRLGAEPFGELYRLRLSP